MVIAFTAVTAYAEPQLNRRNVWNALQYFKHGVTVDETATFNNNVTITGTLTEATGGVTAGEIANVVREINLPLGAFVVETGGAYTPVTSSTAPGMEIDDLIPNIVWADGETTPVQISFPIPADYASGGAFYVLATESSSTTPNQIDFSVYNNADATAADAAATNQTPAALAGTTSTPDLVTLTVATDFASLAANQIVTLNIWRDNTADGTGDLEVKSVWFYYTATQ